MNMNMKKLILATSLCFVAAAASATPTPLSNMTGNVQIKTTGLSISDVNNAAGTNEATWGLGAITSVQGSGGHIWQAGSTDGTYLYYMLYGIADQGPAAFNGTNYTLDNIGATGGVADGLIHLDIYVSNSEIISIDSDYNANPNTRTGYNSDSLLAGLGPAYLNLVFAPGIDLSDPSATLVQTLTANSAITDGKGSFLANVVGGTAAAQWNTNGQPGGTDLYGKFTFGVNGANNGAGQCSIDQVNRGDCFSEVVNDPIQGNKVPEPASLAMVGLGLAALARLRRRKD